MEDLLASLGNEIKNIEKKDREETEQEIKRQQFQIAQNRNGFAPLPSQNKDSIELHKAIVEGFQTKMTPTEMKRRFLARKAKRKQNRKAKRAQQVADKLGEKRNRNKMKKKRKNRIKGIY
uniref:Uncharacterized protein n=1 Tax=Lotharella oceanica TaxID=641309 RepID=A0A7S2XBA7_9EUKA|mmetsp:Transcript_25639/g.47829  ORF Transcript_25639/g.47829 Transcript_25639/m.47829 type:complete len:120 (+) Transcript_25639:57-416(+)|eukprot:CAMPEP_0170181678 /NCGR_PEP_ID=MMETSP0040_2-20121228/25730_1 /TAXON_ID=641309 /ORGANISM="Lotharella oceanica, Strain CCMP622" /LENGTH=119 /DNA_ID=CAMNT_0010426817 /DNA_START=56 /DNA_END=415 /DNA_ORIENTATION=+